jgi:hypothetical protein
MKTFRRITALFMVVSFAGLQPASARCAMVGDADVVVSASAPAGHHAPSPAHQAPSDGTEGAHAADSCSLMTACSAVAHVAISSDRGPSSTFESWAPVTHRIRALVIISFDPPPPRILI